MNKAFKLDKTNIEDIVDLTTLQEGILFHYLKDISENLYFVQLSLEIQGAVKFDYFQQAWNKVIANNEMLRTVFRWEKLNKPIQIILKEKNVDINYYDLLKEENKLESEYQKIKRKDSEESFDLREVPFRLTLCKVKTDKYRLLISNHHIIYDGWSNGIILKEFLNFYNELVTGSSLKVNKKPLFKNYLKLNQKPSIKDESFWKDYLKGIEPKNVFSYKSFNSSTDNSNQSHRFSISEDKFLKLKQLCKSQKISIADILYGAWGILLSKYSGESDILFGTTISGRNKKFEGIEQMVGLFINTIPIRIKITADKALISVLKENAKQTLERGRFENVPLRNILDYSGYKENELIESIFVVENYPLDKENLQKQDELAFKSFTIQETTNYKLTVSAFLSNEIEINFNFSNSDFDRVEIENINKYFVTILDSIINHEESNIQKLELLSESEKQQLLYDFNDTKSDYSKDKTLHQLFEEQVEKTPDNTAVVYQGKVFTYRELNLRSNKLAHYLISIGISGGCYVGVMLDRSIEMIIGVYGILKAGCAYVPLDMSIPQKRLEMILLDVKVGCLLTQQSKLNDIFNISWKLPELANIILLDVNSESIPIELLNKEEVKGLWNYVSKRSTNWVTSGGFYSVYNNEPFSAIEVEEYRDNVLKMALSFIEENDSRVLEIGCGSGIIMDKLASHTKHYTGIDPSDVTQEINKERLKKHKITNVDLKVGFADEIDKLSGEYDIVIIASTVQFFPGIIYLKEIIKKSAELLDSSGVIIISDVMDPEQKDEYVKSIIDYREKHKKYNHLKTDFDSELYVHKNFFYDLQEDIPEIKSVDVKYRKDGFDNELKYRYDVILEKGIKEGFSKQKTNNISKLGVKTSWHVDNQSEFAVKTKISSEEIAYVIYTSGSTGVPKGVYVKHKPVINVIEWVNKTFAISKKDRLIFVTSLTFDLSVYDIFGILASGASLSIVSQEDLLEPTRLIRTIYKEGISFWDSAPAFMQQLVPFIKKEQNNKINLLRLAFFSGDYTPLDLPDILKKVFNKIEVISLGGATEATIWSNYYPINKINSEWSSIPYGKPIQNSKYYILNDHLHLCPIGVCGELYIGGECLASGYINDEELTKSKFILNPFDTNALMYHTGDLARWLPDGNIEFLGRKDNQVKIRGFRIELGEIENVLHKNENIKDSIVIDIEENGDKYLCAYLVTEKYFNEEEIRRYLSENLPDYMIPSYFVALDTIPLTINGKVNRKALPLPEIKAGAGYIAPQTLIQTKLVKIWSEVLNIVSKEISTNVSFFELGGHSLKATVLVSRIHKELGVRLELRDIFQYQTVQGQSELIGLSESTSYFSIPKAKIQEYYPLSSSQRRLYLLQQMDMGSTAYNMPGLIAVPEGYYKHQIEDIFHQLITRHESFRTSFEVVNEIPVQRIHSDVSFSIKDYQITSEELSKVRKDFVKAFDLSKAPILRVGYLEISDGDDILLIDMHHIISDGRSHSILEEEFYKLIAGENLEPLRLQYKDYSEWQNSEKQQERIKGQESYWLDKFAGELPVLEIPIDNSRPVMQDFEGASVGFRLSEEETKIIHNLIKEQGLTLYMSLLSIFTILLSKLSGQDDIIVGSPIAARRHSDLEDIVGMFVNTLAIRSDVSGDKRLTDYLQELKENTLKAYENQEYQFEDLIEKLVVNRDAGHNPLFDVVFNLLEEEYQESTFSTKEELKHVAGVSKFDLSLSALNQGSSIWLSFEYSTKLFKAETIERFICYFKQIINQLPDKLEKNLSIIEIITESEKQQLLYDFNDIKINYPKEKKIYELFEDQVEKSPDSIALVYDDKSLTFDELNKYTNYYALSLLDLGAKGGEIIGIIQERSLNMIIGMLSILKAGCTYCPINPDTPQKRIQFILKECNIKILISDSELVKKELEFSKLNCINLNSDSIQTIQSGIDQELQSRRSKGITSAYIIFTSGSTGNPKGVIINHSNIFPLLYWGYNYLRLDKHDKVIQNLAFYFDWSVWEIFISLTSGSSLELVSKETILDDEKYNLLINKKSITVLHITPTQFQSLTNNNKKLNSIRHLCIGAEKLTLNLVKRSYEVVSNDCIVYNMYGPTEASIMSAVLTIRKSKEDTYESLSSIPIGKPIAKGGLVILNQYMQIQPINIVGELYISGEGLSIGYINDPEKTSNSFIRNIYKTEGIKGEYLYKTGDLARWLPDGDIEFLGRIDHQVKIRGFRIELGEIENTLHKHDNIKDSVVIDIEENGEKYLCAYLVAAEDFNEEGIRTYLSANLPDYMIPSYFVELEKVPLNSNGKVNRKALPLPEIKAGADYVAPKNEIEEKLVEIWSKVLGIEEHQISVRANFFELGGHSLKATILASRINRELGVDISLSEIFRTPIIIDLAVYVRKSTIYKYESIIATERKEYYELSYAQRRLWILCQFEEDSTAYNMPVFFPINEDLNVVALEKSFQTLLERHESLQTIFITVEGEPKQKLINDFKFRLEQINLSDLPEKDKRKKANEIYINDANTAFDLETGPLFRTKLIHLGKDKYILIFNIHHIINDGWSSGIIYNELNSIYYSFLNVNENPLAPLELQYKDYTLWNNSLTGRGKFDKSEKYWVEKFKDKPNGLELPFDHSRQAIQTFNGGRITFSINKEQTQKILQISTENNSTLFMSLLSLVSILLYKYTSQKDIIIGSPIAGRKHLEIDNMIGFLVNTLVYRIDLNPEESFISLLNKIKRETIACYEHQDYPFDLLIEKLELDRDLSQSPLFNVMLAHNNTDKGKADEVNNPNQSFIQKTNKEDYDYLGDFNMSKFDLIFFIDEKKDHLSVKIEYNSDLFERESIKRMADNFTTLLNEVLKNIEKPINILEYIDRREYVQIIEQFNDNKYKYPQLTVQELFEQQVQKTPEKHAVIWNNETISYDDLNKKSNQLAWYLRKTYNIKSNDVIGLSIQRSIEMVIGILGIIKSGAAYLAIDPTYPEDRVLHILEDSDVKLILIDKIYSGLYDKFECSFLNINSDWEKISLGLTSNLPMINKFNDILYVIYTSGSTGTPNGAMLSHGILTNLVQWQKEDTSIESSLRCLQFTSVNFCVSFQEIMTTLTSGGELYLIGEIERQDIDYLMNFLSDNKIEILYLPFSYLNFLFNESDRWEHHFKHNIKHIITAGEQLKITTGLRSFLNQNSEIYLHNHYGSSEMHVVTALTLDSTLIETAQLPPAGKPIANTSIYILDEYYQPNSIGVWGELFISGSTEVLGYVNNRALSDKKILEIPVLKHNKKLYRSGDIGRWLPDGNIELKGRKDEQFKIRGFRVELGEIESKLLGIKEVKECVVVVREDEFNNKYLLAYLVIENLDIFIIKRQMSSFLPKYMIPRLVVLDSLPLMPNGKVDRSKLPEPELDVDLEYVAPTNKIEIKLTEIWSEILAIEKEKIGINDNFFDLGGHSLRAINLISKIHKEFKVKITLMEIFNTNVIKELARLIKNVNVVGYAEIKSIEKREYYHTSSAQKRMYVLNKMKEQDISDNVNFLLRVRNDFDVDRFKLAINKLVDRHEALRTSFIELQNEIYQKINTNLKLDIENFYYESQEEEISLINSFIRPFDLLNSTEVFRIGLLHNNCENYKIIVFDMHHIIADGVTGDVLKNDFNALMGGEDLSPLRILYKDYAEWQIENKQKEEIKKKRKYWMDRFSGELPVLGWETDYERPKIKGFKGETITFNLGCELTSKIRQFLKETDSSLFMFLLSIYNILLSKYSDQEDIIVGTPSAGRRDDELKYIVGYFVNTIALRNYPRKAQTFKEFLKEVKTNSINAFENEDYQFDDLIKDLNLKSDLSRSILFDTMFVVQNASKIKYKLSDEFRSDSENNDNISTGNKVSQFDIITHVIEYQDDLKFLMRYCTDLFKRETMELFRDNFISIINTTLDKPNVNLKDISISHGYSKSNRIMIMEDSGDFSF